MKDSKTLFVCLLLTTSFLLPFSIFGWELEAHKEINKAAFRYFGVNRIASETKFAGISWHDENSPNGVYDVFFFRNCTFGEWLEAGGIDADISSPDKSSLTTDYSFEVKTEKPLRHFYDPVLLTFWRGRNTVWLNQAFHKGFQG